VIYAQVIENESKWKWTHPYISIARGLKSSLNTHSTYDCVFSWVAIIVVCIIVVNVHYTIVVWIKLTMMTSIKVYKPFLVIRIFIHCRIWKRKRWETSFWTCVPFSKTLVPTISQNVLWVILCSFLHGHWNKWVPKSSMVWPH
jgi:hypothetical protein